ncbi:MAG: glycoside hydrolase family 97 N-terminal domain-containing protein [Bacteroides sp.]|nr:glycoside hydrolase family 97 N-terminal domain-containing protein [Bacteroides sp.]
MKNIVIGIFTMVMLSSCFSPEREWKIASPDGNIRITVLSEKAEGEKESRLVYRVSYKEKEVIETSPLGIVREDEQFSRDLKFLSKSSLSLIDEEYTLKSGKRLACHNFAHEQVLTFGNENGKQVELIVRAYNDGVALRYRFPEKGDSTYKVISEETGFKLSPAGTAWIHPYHWNSRQKPSYEDYCESEIEIGTLSPKEQGWAYPMLFQTKNGWVMITEAVMDGTYCATHIRNTPDGLYTVCFTEKDEIVIPDDPQPTSTLPWATPWRVIAISNDLAGIVETNLVQHLNPPSVIADESWIEPGRSSWSWWSDGSSSKSYQAQIRYVDFTADMGWEYTLIDAGWPDMKGGSVEDVVEYANRKNVGVWLWYHSGAGYPQEEVNYFNIMSIPKERKKELARIHKLGVRGIKVDFF